MESDICLLVSFDTTSTDGCESLLEDRPAVGGGVILLLINGFQK